jgi:hypothetical protein
VAAEAAVATPSQAASASAAASVVRRRADRIGAVNTRAADELLAFSAGLTEG